MIATEAVVVGLGAMGAATCRALVGIDRHHPPHAHGSTHGDTRITRLATAEGPHYAPLAMRSHELWRAIEAETGERLLHQVGALMLSRAGSPFLDAVADVGARFELDLEALDAGALRARYPMFSIDDDTAGLLEPTGGYVDPEAAVAAQLALARRDGARRMLGATVTGWAATREGVTVAVGRDTVCGDQLLLCAGPWTAQLLGSCAVSELLAVRRQLVYWFEIGRGFAALSQLPAWVWDVNPGQPGRPPSAAHVRGFYGLPALDGPGGGCKLGTEQQETEHVPDERQHPADEAQIAEMHRRLVADRLPWLGPRARRTLSCLYTCTPDGHFLIDRHPDHPAVTIVSPCSGHGFKHSPAIGEALAQQFAGQTPAVDLSPFQLRGRLSGMSLRRTAAAG